MAGAILSTTGLFMVICVLYGSCQSVPDGQVYTEVKKTLVLGSPGVVTCRFLGDPVAVYWENDLDDLDLKLDLMLVWHKGEVSGPRYDDGSCDIDENYSLIINNVSTVDAGRIYCKVSNYRGILINNYTDVFVADTAIETRSEEILQMGQGTYSVLQCTVRIKARRVSWKKGATSPPNETLVVLENNENSAARSGLGYDEGMYNITEDYSLIIKNLHVHHQGLYVCEATDFDTGIFFQSHTFVNLIASPRKPFPTIQVCMKTDQNDAHYCTVETKSEITLTCQVLGYYPKINLFFLHGSKLVESVDTMEWNNTDGTRNKTVTIVGRESKELYTCVASDIPGSDGRMSTSVLLHDEDTFNSALVITLVCFAALILFSLMAYFIWRRKHRHSDRNYHDYIQVGQVELQHYDDKDVKDLTLEEYQDLLERVDDALMKHYRRIYDLIDTKSTLQTEKIIDENKTALFNAEQMLNDWRQNPESTYHQYMKVMQGATSTGDKSDNVWPSNEELGWISRHLKQESMKKICKKLKITYKPEDNSDEEKRYNKLRAWRNKVAHKNVEEKHEQLFSAIGSEKLIGLLPPLKGSLVYKAELVDMAFNLMMQDLLPVAEALGINATKLVSYRPAFQLSHLEIGTIDLLSKLLNSVTVDWQKQYFDKGDVRNIFYNEIGKLRYRNVTTCGMVAHDMSYGELYAIAEAMASTKGKAIRSQALPGDTSEAGSQSEEGKSEKDVTSKIPEDGTREAFASVTEKAVVIQKLPGDTSKAATQSEEDKYEKGAASNIPGDENKERNDIENRVNEKTLLMVSRDQMSEPEKALKDTKTMDHRTGKGAVEIPEDLVDLQRVLQLTDQDIADGLGSSLPITAYELFKIWKGKPRPSVFNYRAAIAHELRGIQMPDLADDIIAGKYIKEQTSLEFIENIVQGLTQGQKRNLGKLLGLSGKDEQWHINTPINVICQQVYEWAANWTKKMRDRVKVVEILKEVSLITTTSGKHRAFNDKLVEQGFLDLAREIMIIEQQIN